MHALIAAQHCADISFRNHAEVPWQIHLYEWMQLQGNHNPNHGTLLLDTEKMQQSLVAAVPGVDRTYLPFLVAH